MSFEFSRLRAEFCLMCWILDIVLAHVVTLTVPLLQQTLIRFVTQFEHFYMMTNCPWCPKVNNQVQFCRSTEKPFANGKIRCSLSWLLTCALVAFQSLKLLPLQQKINSGRQGAGRASKFERPLESYLVCGTNNNCAVEWDDSLLLIRRLVSICFDSKLIEMSPSGEGHQSNIGLSKDSQQQSKQCDLFTFESISTSFFSWLDPSTLMLSSFANSYWVVVNLRASSHTRASHFSSLLVLCWPEQWELRQTSSTSAQPLWQLLLLDRGGGWNAGGRERDLDPDRSDDDFSEQLPRPRQAFLDSLPEPLRLFPRLRGSFCGSMAGRPDSRCLESMHTPQHTLTLW